MCLKARQLALIEGIRIMQTLQLLYLINPIEKSPWEATSSSASQEIPCILYTINRRFTATGHVSVFWVRSILSIPPHLISWRSILISSPHLRLGLASGLSTKTLYAPLPSYIRATFPSPSHLTSFQRTCPVLRLSVPLRKTLTFYGEEMLVPQRTLHDEWPTLVGCTRLLIQYIRS
jgi:hypothetical protein